MRPFMLDLDRREAQHPGLLLERYFTTDTVTDPQPDDRQRLLVSTETAARSPELLGIYRLAFERWQAQLPKETSGDLGTPPFSRLIVGLGQESVLEAGLRLHHTYGVPVVPGSGLKGLASHYCHTVWGQFHEGDKAAEENKKFRRGEPYHDLLFGYTRKSEEADAGAITFHDAWITPESLAKGAVLRDVMTPHHPQWQDGGAPPTDFDSPTPVSFLSVAGAFRVAVSWNGPPHDKQQDWTQLAFALLKEALWNWGVGGKTSSGYGRLGDEDKIKEAAAVPKGAGAAVGGGPIRPAAKRSSGLSVSVTVVGTRAKGYDVQEVGKPQGVLTVGTPPTPPPNVGDVIQVEIHNDEAKPQYRWPTALPTKGGAKPKR